MVNAPVMNNTSSGFIPLTVRAGQTTGPGIIGSGSSGVVSTQGGGPGTFAQQSSSPTSGSSVSQAAPAQASGIPKPGQLTNAQLMAQYPGYSFNAAGQLTNAQGQQYVAPSTGNQPSILPVPSSNGYAGAGNSYNAQGQVVPTSSLSMTQGAGSTPVPDLNAPGNPNTATGSTFNNSVGTLAQTASQPLASYNAASNDVNSEKQQLAALQSQAAQAQGSVNNTPGISLQGATGESGQIQNTLAGMESPIAAELAQSQAQLQSATAQQGIQQSGLGAAAGLVAPTPANTYGMYNPATGLVTGYNSGTASSPSTSGVATAGAVQTQAQQGAAVQNMTGMLKQATGLSDSVTTAMQQAGYNPASGLGPAQEFANGVNQWFQKQSGNAQYSNVANLLGEVASKYAAILQQAGGTPTTVSQIQQQIIDGLMSQESINTILGDLQANAQKSIDSLNTASQSNATQTSGGGSGGTVTAGGNSYVQNAQGQWVPSS